MSFSFFPSENTQNHIIFLKRKTPQQALSFVAGFLLPEIGLLSHPLLTPSTPCPSPPLSKSQMRPCRVIYSLACERYSDHLCPLSCHSLLADDSALSLSLAQYCHRSETHDVYTSVCRAGAPLASPRLASHQLSQSVEARATNLHRSLSHSTLKRTVRNSSTEFENYLLINVFV